MATDNSISSIKTDIEWIKKECKEIKQNHVRHMGTFRDELKELSAQFTNIQNRYLSRIKPLHTLVFAALLSLLVGLITFLLTK